MHQTASAFDTELNSYLSILSKTTDDQLLGYDPLVFWPRHASALPILARLARRFLSPAPTSCSVEEFFSIVGRICSPLRSRLFPDMLQSLSCLYGWKRAELGYCDGRVGKRQRVSDRFAKLNINLELVSPDEVINTACEEELQEDLTEDMAIEELEKEVNT